MLTVCYRRPSCCLSILLLHSTLKLSSPMHPYHPITSPTRTGPPTHIILANPPGTLSCNTMVTSPLRHPTVPSFGKREQVVIQEPLSVYKMMVILFSRLITMGGYGCWIVMVTMRVNYQKWRIIQQRRELVDSLVAKTVISRPPFKMIKIVDSIMLITTMLLLLDHTTASVSSRFGVCLG